METSLDRAMERLDRLICSLQLKDEQTQEDLLDSFADVARILGWDGFASSQVPDMLQQARTMRERASRMRKGL